MFAHTTLKDAAKGRIATGTQLIDTPVEPGSAAPPRNSRPQIRHTTTYTLSMYLGVGGGEKGEGAKSRE